MSLSDHTVDNPHPDNPVIVDKDFETPEHRIEDTQDNDLNENNEDNEIDEVDEVEDSGSENVKQEKIGLDSKQAKNGANDDSSTKNETKQDNLLWSGSDQ